MLAVGAWKLLLSGRPRLRAAAPRKVPSTVGRGVVAVKATGASRHHETGRSRSVECGVRRIDATQRWTYLLPPPRRNGGGQRMDPVSAWTLMAFMAVVSAALLLLEVGMRRARGDG